MSKIRLVFNEGVSPFRSPKCIDIDIFLIIKPTRYTNFSNLFLEWNSTCFGQFLCPLPGVFHCTHSNAICHTGLLTACKQDQDGTAVPSWSCSQVVSKPVWHIPLLELQFHSDPARKLSANLCGIYHRCVQWKIPDDGQRNCPKHVEIQFKNKFEKLANLVGFIIRNKRYISNLLSTMAVRFVRICYLRHHVRTTDVMSCNMADTLPSYFLEEHPARMSRQ